MSRVITMAFKILQPSYSNIYAYFYKPGSTSPTFLYKLKAVTKPPMIATAMSMFGGDLLCQHVKLVSGTLSDHFRQNSVEHL